MQYVFTYLMGKVKLDKVQTFFEYFQAFSRQDRFKEYYVYW